MDVQESPCLYGWLPKAIQHRLQLSGMWTQAGSTCKGHHFKNLTFPVPGISTWAPDNQSVNAMACLLNEKAQFSPQSNLEAFLGDMSVRGPGTQTRVASHSTFQWELCKNGTKKIINQSPLQIDWWKHEVDRSDEAWETSAIDLRCYLTAFWIFGVMGTGGSVSTFQRIYLMVTKMLAHI